MIVDLKERGLFTNKYEVTAEEGEVLTEAIVRAKFEAPFGCTVRQVGSTYYVDKYTD